MAPEPATPAGAQSRPLYVVVADGRASTSADAAPRVRIEQLPGGCTTGDLARRLTAEGGGRAGDGHLRMLVRSGLCLGVKLCALPSLCRLVLLQNVFKTEKRSFGLPVNQHVGDGCFILRLPFKGLARVAHDQGGA